MNYYKIVVISLLIILVFILCVPYNKNFDNTELFNSERKINIVLDNDHDFVSIFMSNFKKEEQKQINYFGQVSKKVAEEKYNKHLERLKNGYYDYQQRINENTETPEIKPEEVTQPIDIPNDPIDLRINFK